MQTNFWYGRLSLDAIPYHNPIVRDTDLFIICAGIFVVGLITVLRKWTYLWKEWITTIDHKKIGTMYIILALIMLLRGFADAALMRGQQAVSVGTHYGYLPPDHFSQIFTAHGVIMIFFMAMPLMFGLINWALPLQIGARDVAFPYLNSFSLWMTVVGAALVMLSLLVGKFAMTGWLAYPPLSELRYSPGVGVDYYLWALQIAGIGSLLSGVNFVVTILKMRAPGMKLSWMPIFPWTVLCAMILVMLAFPVLTVTLGMLLLDRYMGMHFFTNGMGGNAMMYVNLIWAWGHPEVYILILPAFGIFSEVTANFCRKKLFGYMTMVVATAAITFLSFVVWLHHFFTMGAGADVNAFFGIATMIIAIPTGVKIFNWLFTMYKGRIHYYTPMMFTLAFLLIFVVGGMTGVLMAVPGVDFQVHNSVFLVAHFHNVIIGGVVFGFFAGLIYWYPKIFGYRLNEGWGKASVYLWSIGFIVAFGPLYAVGLKGMTRRLYHYSATSGYHPYLIVAAIGAVIIAIAVVCQVLQFVVGIWKRDEYKSSADSWGYGRTLEWSIPSPAPFYNFAVIPQIHARDDYWETKEKIKNGHVPAKPVYKDIHMPKNTAAGFIIAMFNFVFGFAMIWHIHWLAALGFIGIIATVIARTFNTDVDYYVKAEEVERTETELLSGQNELGRFIEETA
jgi:cytochrome o ubiquinol oxidase subunit 1